MKFSQQMVCDVTGGSARGAGGGERGGRLVVSPVHLAPSQTLLENPKQVKLDPTPQLSGPDHYLKCKTSRDTE